MGSRRRGARSLRGREGPGPTKCAVDTCFDPLVRKCVDCKLLRTPELGPASPPPDPAPPRPSLPSAPCSPSPSAPPAAGLGSLVPGTALQPQESVGAGAAAEPEPEAALPLPALLFGAPALLGLALALVLAGLLSWRWRRRRLRAAAAPGAPDPHPHPHGTTLRLALSSKTYDAFFTLGAASRAPSLHRERKCLAPLGLDCKLTCPSETTWGPSCL
ncbi:tumor necrosis factor receptor superfamily member 13C isoform X2 [Hyaena hyaena]|uniref:tumor necrosis factor receptor superfamily member 13C isoform X2 n=1 Tax=Hyaena hyaena TaxID=95912 RepID=UPI001922BAFB|nr:tumor necrosis factor receptor superfamily member 13C isoform X2 [Hyaena hyaena]